MRKLTMAIACCASAAGLLAASALLAGPRLTGEERLAKLLDGRVAGEPQSCISAPNMSQLTVIDKTALVYKAGSTIYVNRPANPKSLNSGDILVIDRLSHQLCNTDMVNTRSQGPGHFFTGSVFLGQFVPYKKVANAG
jgi:hypothetical protein